MLENHRSNVGEVTMICDMTDTHLKATIGAVCRKIIEVKKVIATAAGSDPLDEYNRLMHGSEKINVERAVLDNRRRIEFLYPYLAEAFLRNLTDTRDILVDAMGRDSGLGRGSRFEVKLDPAEDGQRILRINAGG